MLLCLDTFKMIANPHFSVVHSEDDRPDRDSAGQPAVPAKTVSQTNRKYFLLIEASILKEDTQQRITILIDPSHILKFL